MCGLVGVVNKRISGFTKQQQEVFSSLLFLDYLRGMDSTGVFLVSNNGDVNIAKEASNPIDFMNTKEYDDIQKKAWRCGSALIGHNRKATRGDITDENAHPFVVDDKIILVHNGTMFGDHKKIADVEVDSHAIAHAIHEKQDVAAALSSFDAAYALMWYDFDASVLNLIRNSQRPLWFMETNDEWVWSSERAMLEFVRNRHDLKLTNGPTELLADEHITYKLTQYKGWEAEHDKLEIKKSYSKGTMYFPGQNDWVPSVGDHASQDWWENQYERFNEGADADDVPFDKTPVGGAVVPITHAQQVETRRRATTSESYERTLARRMNKIVTNAEFTHSVVNDYKQNTIVHAIAFDYRYANLKDEKGGYYLYLSIADDRDVIVRVHFENKYATEQRMQALAADECVFTVQVQNLMWASMNPTGPSSGSATPGYAVIWATHPKLIHGAGVDDPAWRKVLH